MSTDHESVKKTLAAARQRLLDARTAKGNWVGELSSSALSTATAVVALELVRQANSRSSAQRSTTTRPHHSPNDSELGDLVQHGLAWLSDHQNEDGGWGDTTESPSNISTTVLGWAAIKSILPLSPAWLTTADRAESLIRTKAGGLSPAELSQAIGTVYGRDKTFSVPILMMCAICGRLGTGREAWVCVSALPFELAALPHSLFRWLGLPVVSYALPALIAIGQARHYHRPTRNPVTRLLRWLTQRKTLRVLQSIQPPSGGFLEAAPLTSFVVMSLASMGHADHPVARRGIDFLKASVRDDGSWPIDTSLSLWVTTLAINALAATH